jgi:ubiquinone/menaquinone biosynthesis C-methylase UbiE
MQRNADNLDPNTVADFGREWARFDQGALPAEENARLFREYFAVFPWASLPPEPVGFDAGCGSGRWAASVTRRVARLHCIDASSKALEVARRNLGGADNVEFHEAPISAMPIADASMDFGYSLGVLHHLPDPSAGLAACVRKLKPGAPMLVYIYYALDNRPAWFRMLWQASDYMRRTVSKMPFRLKAAIADLSAALIYWPLARTARLAERLGFNIAKWPLSAYSLRSYYTMRTDALDRFGTRLEHRMKRAEIEAMMEAAGLRDIRFSDSLPYWCAVGYRV